MITLATAHPAKFADAVRRATGSEAAVPAHVGDTADREERFTVVENRYDAVLGFIEDRVALAEHAG